MRKSKMQHNLARLRLEFLNSKPSQKEFADRLGVGVELIKSIENLRETLTSDLAVRIGHLTNISPTWLLQNDTSAPPTDLCGNLYDRDRGPLVFQDQCADGTTNLRPIKVLILESLEVIAETVLRAAEQDRIRTYTYDLQISLRELWAKVTDHAPPLLEITDVNLLVAKLREQSDAGSRFLRGRLPKSTQQLLRPSWALGPGDIKNFPAFLLALKQREDKVVAFFWQNLSEAIRRRITTCKDSKRAAEILQDDLVTALNGVIGGELIYEKSRFAGKSLPLRTRDDLERKPKGTELARLNRRLLAEACPSLFPPELGKTEGQDQLLRQTLGRDLTRIVRKVDYSSLYREAQSAEVKFASETEQLQRQQPKGEAEVRLNCFILRDASLGLIKEASIPSYIPRCQELVQCVGKLYLETVKSRPNYQPLLDTFFACLEKELQRKREEGMKKNAK